MFRERLLAALVIVALLVGALYADYAWTHDSVFLHLFVLLVSFLAFKEFWPLCKASGHQTFSTWGTISGCALVVIHYFTLPHVFNAPLLREAEQADRLLDGAMVASVLVAFLLSAHRHQYPASLGGLGVTCLGMIYIWYLPSFILKLRHMGSDGRLGGLDWNRFGTKMVIATIVISKGCDVWAFLIGRRLGRHKAFPELSPGKTVEGVVAGLLGSSALALLLSWEHISVLPIDAFGVAGVLGFGLAIGISGMMGDLAESLLKRSAGVKEASHLVPGYGGVLDVVDSLMVAGPVAYFLVPLIIR